MYASGKMTDADLYVLAGINSGLRCDLKRLHGLDAEIERLLDEAKAFPGISSQASEVDWQSLSTELGAIRDHAESIDKAMEGNPEVQQKNWKAIQKHDRRVEATFLRLRDSAAATLPEDVRLRWKDLWRRILGRFEAIRARAMVAQAKSEMRTRYGAAKTDEISQQILSHMPEDADLAEASRYAAEYRKAFDEYEKNKEIVGGFLGVVRALLMMPDDDPDTVARRRIAGVTGLAI